MKTIANCNLEEFLSQTNKIRKKVAEYYKICKIGSIRKIMPAFEDNDTPEAKAKKIQESLTSVWNSIRRRRLKLLVCFALCHTKRQGLWTQVSSWI